MKLPELLATESKYIVMDNAAIHKTRDVAEAFARENYILKFIPLYSEHLNLIEEFFSCIKARVRRRGINMNKIPLIAAMEEILSSVVFDLNGYFNHMRRWVEKASARMDFI
ncbi:hypothetical protein DMUE_3247 [Dictyocoela muelleri]|nr:hypothetical protein DMUE_3247 [Dictyocoela muelleri]